MTKGNNDRIGGATALLKALGNPDENVKPRLFFFDTCTHIIRCMPELQHNPNRPEDVLKVDVDEEGEGGDDAYDCARLGFFHEVNIFARYKRAKKMMGSRFL